MGGTSGDWAEKPALEPTRRGSNSSCDISQLCGLGCVPYPLWALMSSFRKRVWNGLDP